MSINIIIIELSVTLKSPEGYNFVFSSSMVYLPYMILITNNPILITKKPF